MLGRTYLVLAALDLQSLPPAVSQLTQPKSGHNREGAAVRSWLATGCCDCARRLLQAAGRPVMPANQFKFKACASGAARIWWDLGLIALSLTHWHGRYGSSSGGLISWWGMTLVTFLRTLNGPSTEHLACAGPYAWFWKGGYQRTKCKNHTHFW